MENEFSHLPVMPDECIEALNIKPNSAVMIRTRISYDKEGRIIEYTKMNYNASLYSYTIELYNH